MRFCVVGAGFSGAIIARHLSEKGYRVLLIDERSHLAGNCHTERDAKTGIMLHRYGPHIFHTSNLRAWKYVNRFGDFEPYVNRVKAVSGGRVYTLPINLLTINQFFGKTFSPREAYDFIRTKADQKIFDPDNFEDQALSMIGPELYHAFFTVIHASNGVWTRVNCQHPFSRDYPCGSITMITISVIPIRVCLKMVIHR